MNSSNHSLSQSLTFRPNTLSSSLTLTADRVKQEEELMALKKQVRQKEAEFMKEKAILVQQVELLKMQLSESGEREANLKKINENIMIAFQNHQTEDKSIEIEITEDHPKVQELVKLNKQEFMMNLQQEKERNRQAEYQLERDNQQMSFKIADLQKQLEIVQQQYDYQVKEYQSLLQRFNEDMKQAEDKLRSDYELRIIKLNGELEQINADIERQVMLRLNERYQKDQEQNELIIKYQKEQQAFLDEQTAFRKRIELLEREVGQLQDKVKKAEDENGAIRYRSKQQEKKHKEDLDALRKLKDEAEKRVDTLEQLQNKKFSSTSVHKKQVSTISVKSRNKVTQNINKENIACNKSQHGQELVDDDEEKNKLRRQISLLRSQLKKLEVEIKDLKMKSNQEIAQLKDKLNVERKKRMNIYEDKIDKNNQLLQDLIDKDQTIISLNRQISKLQEKLQIICGGNMTNRSGTPNHLLATSMQESMYHHNFTQSMAELFPNMHNQTTTSHKKLISPLRSLDLTLLNKDNINNLNSLSFSLLPIQPRKNKRNTRQSSLKKKQALTTSPQQIKRNRINSVQINTRISANNLASSLNMAKGLRVSRDASIAEVNEDLYRDSVESLHEIKNHDFETLEQRNIMLQFDKPTKVKNYYSLKNPDQELQQTLLGNDKLIEKEIFYDSLDNNSQTSENEDVAQFIKQYQSNIHQNMNQEQERKVNNKQIKHKKNQSVHVPQQKLSPTALNEDDDCLVNILEQEDTNIEVQPTVTHPRQNLSTENLFRESQNTIESLKTFRNHNIQRQIRDVNRQKQASIPIPKPQKKHYQKSSVNMPKLNQDRNKSIKFEERNNSMTKPSEHNGDSTMMKSPSSPNIFIKSNTSGGSKQSNNKNKMQRMDSSPSLLDEDETVLTLGSGEKLRVRETAIQNLHQYQNQYKQKFKVDTKPPTTTKNTGKGNSNFQKFGFRTRTNSMINSCCSETSFKMKFIKDMPNMEPQQSARVQTHKHSRVPSLKLPINRLQGHGQIKTFIHTHR